MHCSLIVLASFALSHASTENRASHSASIVALQRRYTDRVTFIPASFSLFRIHHSHRIKKAAPSIPTLPKNRPRPPCTLRRVRENIIHDDDDIIDSSSSRSPDPYSQYTHQIAIPLSDSSELTSALRSIQTSLIRDCPRLIRACITPASLRLPLLYVKPGRTTKARHVDVEAAIERVVHDAIRRATEGENEGPILLPFRGLELQGEDNSVLYAVGYDVRDRRKRIEDDDDDDDGVYVVDDWSSNEIAAGPSGYKRLQRLVEAIQRELEDTHGFQTCWPSDEPQGQELFDNDDAIVEALETKQQKWRPRVPFVRLPPNFYNDLQNDNAQTLDDDRQQDRDPTSRIDTFFSKGFDGISPAFWYDAWAERDILPSPGVRMRSVAVYRRIMSDGEGEAESNFYPLPPSYSSPVDGLAPGSPVNNAGEREKGRNRLDLPLGDGKLMAREARERAEEMERMGEMERREEFEWEEMKARWLEGGSRDSRQDEAEDVDLDEEDYSEFDVSIETGEVTVDGDAAYTTPWSERGLDTTSVFEVTAKAATEGEKTILESDATIPSQNPNSTPISSLQTLSTPPEKKQLPNIKDNPIFQRFWKGEAQLNAQGESTAQTLDGTPPSTEEALPPYPSNEHFVGVWRVLSSPLGVESFPDGGSSTSAPQRSSDNLVLRVDGQVMGGPILDAEYRQKAAGGSWKMFRAVRRSGNDGEEKTRESKAVQTRLRVRLLVPPEKVRVLVMEGEVTRLGFGGKDASFSSAFVGDGGLLDGMSSEKLLKDGASSSRNDTGDESLIFCAGEAWMEDVDGGRRRKLGPFSLMKLKTVDRSKLIYTVPASRLGQGAPDGDDI
ncbi:hypothetical protein ACHAWX_007685 [Stephanocyclus meneghinianus]